MKQTRKILLYVLAFCLFLTFNQTNMLGNVVEATDGGIIKATTSSLQNEPQGKEVVAKVEKFTFTTTEQIDSTVLEGLDSPYGNVSEINEFWGADGNYNITYSGENKVYISVINQEMILQKTLEIPKDLPLVGNVIQDKVGNYYIVYGKYDTADMESDINVGTEVVMSIIQYNSEGKLLSKLTYTGFDTCSSEGIGWGTKEPFNFGNCDLLIDTTGVLICRYGRVMYSGHQSSHALYVNTGTMTKLDYIAPYNSHSYDQKIIETTDGGYLYADRGDAYERGFVVFKGSKNMDINSIVPTYIPFHFRNGYIYQTTYAMLAGIAECSNGYALAGASEKTLSYDVAEDESFNESRNIFLQVFSKDIKASNKTQPNIQMLNGETRITTGTYISGTGNCENGAVDYGVLWLTNYTGTKYASNPKMINIGNDKLLIMWEKKNYNKDSLEQYIESCYMVVSSVGTIIIPETTIQDEHLTEYGEPNYKDGYILWTTSDGDSKNFVVHRLAIGE